MHEFFNDSVSFAFGFTEAWSTIFLMIQNIWEYTKLPWLSPQALIPVSNLGEISTNSLKRLYLYMEYEERRPFSKKGAAQLSVEYSVEV